MVSQVLYYNQAQQYPGIQRDYKDVRSSVEKTDKADKKASLALEAIPAFRRLESVKEDIQNGEYAPAIGLASLAVINLPEDLRDMKSSYKQIFDKNYKPSYNHAEYQHRFSFFRGTLLENMVNPNKAKNKELAEKLHNADKTLAETSFGQKIMKLLNVDITDVTKSSREDFISTKENPKYVEAFKFEGQGKFKTFGELTARAMSRTTLIGTAVLAALELPKIFKAMNNGDNIAEQTGNTVKQTAKSGINVASITAGIGYGGAIGAKHYGATGSLLGMGAGAVIGAFTSKKIQDVIG